MVDEALIKRTDIVWFTDFIFYRALCTPDYTFPGLIINPQPWGPKRERQGSMKILYYDSLSYSCVLSVV